MFHSFRTWAALLAVMALLAVAAGPVAAQTVILTPPARVSYYAAPVTPYYVAPVVSYYAPPVVSYYAPPVVAPTPVVVGYAARPAVVLAPTATVTTYRYGVLPWRRVRTVTYYGR